MGNKAARVARSLAHDLLSLEVQTRVVDHIPPSAHPLPKRLADLARTMKGQQGGLEAAPGGGAGVEIDEEDMKGLGEAFAELSEYDPAVARTMSSGPEAGGLETGPSRHEPRDLEQQRSMTRALGAILKEPQRKPAGPATMEDYSPEQRLQLRKYVEALERGLVARTVVWLDGDVQTTVVRSAADQPVLLEAHQLGVRAALSYWSALARALSDLAGSLFTKVFDDS